MSRHHSVVFSPEARDDLQNLYRYIATQSGSRRAIGYLRRIERYCRGFSEFPLRGIARSDLLPGLRVVGFDRRTTLAFLVEDHHVIFVRVLYGGRDISEMSV